MHAWTGFLDAYVHVSGAQARFTDHEQPGTHSRPVQLDVTDDASVQAAAAAIDADGILPGDLHFPCAR
ncbi:MULTISPECIES: hypothetical protein [Frankia]|uniref:Uncharacterized protein n=1 Tax=Frankia alni (strain DSM 45986 / CECT 9034 / ACN14a) TaxID=326424 RepID=Q0RJP0_FRAAA|nr:MULTISPECIES: hypothetical protein [Frankia]CAJ62272.1 hypothetical protein FRAAL3629 [Frankia alni ACN14a]